MVHNFGMKRRKADGEIDSPWAVHCSLPRQDQRTAPRIRFPNCHTTVRVPPYRRTAVVGLNNLEVTFLTEIRPLSLIVRQLTWLKWCPALLAEGSFVVSSRNPRTQRTAYSAQKHFATLSKYSSVKDIKRPDMADVHIRCRHLLTINGSED